MPKIRKTTCFARICTGVVAFATVEGGAEKLAAGVASIYM